MSEVVTTNYEKSADVIVAESGEKKNRRLCEGQNFNLNKHYHISTNERRNAENNAR